LYLASRLQNKRRFLVKLLQNQEMHLSTEALAKVIFVILSAAKDLDSSVACGSLRMTIFFFVIVSARCGFGDSRISFSS